MYMLMHVTPLCALWLSTPQGRIWISVWGNGKRKGGERVKHGPAGPTRFVYDKRKQLTTVNGGWVCCVTTTPHTSTHTHTDRNTCKTKKKNETSEEVRKKSVHSIEPIVLNKPSTCTGTGTRCCRGSDRPIGRDRSRIGCCPTCSSLGCPSSRPTSPWHRMPSDRAIRRSGST